MEYQAVLGERGAPNADGFGADPSTRSIRILDRDGNAVYSSRSRDSSHSADNHIRQAGFQRDSPWVDGKATVSLIPQAVINKKRAKIGAIAGAVVLGVAGCSVWMANQEPEEGQRVVVEQPTVEPPFTARGTLLLSSETSVQPLFNVNTGEESSCQGTGGYEDLTYGTSVIILGPQDEPLATSTIQETEMTPQGCVFTWQVPSVRPGLSSYSVQVSYRDGATYSQTELEAGVELGIGG